MATPYALPAFTPLTADAGATLPIAFAATLAAGGAADLTTATITCLVKRSLGDPDALALATLTTANGGVQVATPASAGLGTALVPASALRGLDPCPVYCWYTIRAALATGEVYDLQRGTILVYPAAIQAPAVVSGPSTLARNTAETIRLALTNNDASDYDLTGISLLWVATQSASTITKSQALGTISVPTPTNGIAYITILASDTAGLLAGTLAWTLTDSASGVELGSGAITIT